MFTSRNLDRKSRIQDGGQKHLPARYTLCGLGSRQPSKVIEDSKLGFLGSVDSIKHVSNTYKEPEVQNPRWRPKTSSSSGSLYTFSSRQPNKVIEDSKLGFSGSVDSIKHVSNTYKEPKVQNPRWRPKNLRVRYIHCVLLVLDNLTR